MNDDQLEHARRIAYLVTGFIRNDLTSQERQELDEWIAANDENMKLFGQLTDQRDVKKSKAWFESLDVQGAEATVFNRAGIQRKTKERLIQLIVIAAASVIVIAIFAWFWMHQHTREQEEVVSMRADSIRAGSTTAMLYTGRQMAVDLSDRRNSRIPIDDNNQAINSAGVLSYTKASSTVQWHTLFVPRGGEYQLLLPDGTRVWLNAETSLRFPTVFDGPTRNVHLMGEAYFEVAQDRSKPFVVSTKGAETKVLGTHFNIEGYEQSAWKLTLLEGSVQIRSGRDSAKLKPGQQVIVAYANSNARPRNKDEGGKGDSLVPIDDSQFSPFTFHFSPDPERAIAWTKGRFSFKSTSIKEVAAQLGRWYDITFDFGSIHEEQRFTGDIKRNSSLQEVLNMLTLSTRISVQYP